MDCLWNTIVVRLGPSNSGGSGSGGGGGKRWVQTLFLLASTLTFMTSQSLELENVAVGRPAAMDSLYEADNSIAYAKHAVDGDASKTAIWEYSCAHSGDNSPNPHWWIVDLLREYDIREVWITNRDSFHGRLQNFTIDVFREYPNSISGFPFKYGEKCAFQASDGTYPGASQTKKYPCTSPVRGRYVRVVLYFHFALVMCEVQVMAPANVKNFYATRHPGKTANLAPYALKSDVRSYVHCASLCSLDENCNAFTWRQTALQCGLIKSSPYDPTALIMLDDPDTDLTLNFDITASG